ncbi:hypothetical protein [Vulcaniibacterium tengchongense]|uniref:Uncharacterized protein n=1 Tax=Vulcaniibacterium tengchongense TaxID=1273429 RepID=A0A3N4VKL7_9GAMM|nr:hypothetical protein [Vulcaniibacterium tengchongense]RPE81965.1 hypothetical protein EDC50_1168 [Vulcaniibacterium tengchongense]
MAFSVTVRVLEVTCNDKESGGDNRDSFILLGAVVADGQSHAFGFEGVALRSDESFTYYESVFEGIVDQGVIGLALSGWETDRSSDWKRVREDVKKVAEGVATVVDKLDIPVVGTIASKVIEYIPEGIDFFARLDKDDNILKWAGELPLSSPPHRESTEVYTFRARGKKKAGFVVLSTWDYEVTVAVTCADLVPLFPADTPAIRWSRREHVDSKVEDWLGRFRNGRVACSIVESRSLFGPLKIHFTDETGQEFEIPRARIVNRSAPLVEAHHGNVLTLRPLGMKRIEGEPRVTNAAALLVSRGDDLAKIRDRAHPAEVSRRKNKLLEKHVLLALGGDRVALPNGGILEIHETLADGEPTGGHALRYVRPATLDSVLLLANPDIDLMLEPYSEIH